MRRMESMEIAVAGIWVVLSGFMTYILKKIRTMEDEDYLPRNEIERMVRERINELQNEVEKLQIKIDHLNDQTVSMSILLGRIDERLSARRPHE